MLLDILTLNLLTFLVLIVLGHLIFKIIKRKSLSSLYLFLKISIPLVLLRINFIYPKSFLLEAILLIYLGVNSAFYIMDNHKLILNFFKNKRHG